MKTFIGVVACIVAVGFIERIPVVVERADAPRKDAFSAPATERTLAMSLSTVRVYRTYYCATGAGCSNPICGGNERTAWGRDATIAGGCAVDPRRIPYGSTVEIDGVRYVADDTFGRAQRERDWKAEIIHVDIRVAGRMHDDVRRMGAGWTDATIDRRDK